MQGRAGGALPRHAGPGVLPVLVCACCAGIAGRSDPQRTHGPGAAPVGLGTARTLATDARKLRDRALVEQAAGRLAEAVTLAQQARGLARRVHGMPGFAASQPPVE